jgi:hypothetical protein
MIGAASLIRKGSFVAGKRVERYTSEPCALVKIATMTIPSDSSLRNVAYGRPDGSGRPPATTSSGSIGTLAAVAYAGRSSVARAPLCSTFQPSAGRNPSPTGP